VSGAVVSRLPRRPIPICGTLTGSPLLVPGAVTPPDPLSVERRRHRFYSWLLVVNLFLMVCLALPGTWGPLTYLGYIALSLLLAFGLGRKGLEQPRGLRLPLFHLYRLLGIVSVISLVLWLLIPQRFGYTGIPLSILFSVFVGLGVTRLVHQLSLERRVGADVVKGAFAGYLLLGLSGGLVLAVLETVMPGSFSMNNDHLPPGSLHLQSLDHVLHPLNRPDRVWEMNFMQINYFAFVSLTTVGYGDIVPIHPTAQMASIGLSVIGPLYIAVVMGVLISRLTNEQNRDDLPSRDHLLLRRHGPLRDD